MRFSILFICFGLIITSYLGVYGEVKGVAVADGQDISVTVTPEKGEGCKYLDDRLQKNGEIKYLNIKDRTYFQEIPNYAYSYQEIGYIAQKVLDEMSKTKGLNIADLTVSGNSDRITLSLKTIVKVDSKNVLAKAFKLKDNSLTVFADFDVKMQNGIKVSSPKVTCKEIKVDKFVIKLASKLAFNGYSFDDVSTIMEQILNGLGIPVGFNLNGIEYKNS